MKLLQHKGYFIFCFLLILTGAFSLLWMRQQVYLQASQNRILEKHLSSLVELNKRADLCIAKLNNENMSHTKPIQSQKVIWISTSQETNTYIPLAFNH